jgi:predicted nucleotidyltransferase
MSQTVSTLSADELAAYRQALKSHHPEITPETRKRHQRAWDVARRAAQYLKDEFSASKVVVFGSLLRLELFHVTSDIDLAAWGIDKREYYRAVGVLQSLDPDFEIDLIDFEDVSERLSDIILSDGVEL